jgi:hypothetical protein
MPSAGGRSSAGVSASRIQNDRVQRRREPYVPPTTWYSDGRAGVHGGGPRQIPTPRSNLVQCRHPASNASTMHRQPGIPSIPALSP